MMRVLIPMLGLTALSCANASSETDPVVKTNIPVIAKNNNQFALDLYAKLRGADGNLFFSPYSISTALAMTRAGARGETAAEMDQTLHFTLPGEQLQQAFGALVKEVNGDPTDAKRGYQLSTANALWGQKGFGFKADFLKLVNNNYGAGLNEVDFKNATEQARGVINAWVEKETHDKIQDLLHQGDLTPDTRLVLTNAIYFKGDWASPFQKEQTKQEPFHLSADRKADAPLMHQTEEYGYLDGRSFHALELPYSGKNLTMVVLLPKKVDGLADFEKDFTADKLAAWIGKLRKQKVIVALPKFKTTQRISLAPTLSEMGMKQAFTAGADFSGMGGDPGDLGLSDVIHKAFIDVNEEGTEAAAATAVIVAGTAAVRVEPTPVFRADHPFVFLIRDTRSDSILFLGRIVDPAK
jgi:serine protease inhibitor